MDTLTDSRVGLFGHYADLLKNDSFGMRSSAERIGLPPCSQMSLLVVKISPYITATIFDVLTSSTESTGLILTTRRLIWEQGGRPILSAELLMPKESFLRRSASRPNSPTLLSVSVSVSN